MENNGAHELSESSVFLGCSIAFPPYIMVIISSELPVPKCQSSIFLLKTSHLNLSLCLSLSLSPGRERGNQRERDRERAQARAAQKAKNAKGDGLTPEQRRERDAKALQEKAAKKAAQAAGAGAGGDKISKK
ncbi:hypothetical protein M5689_019135 [Euphorbia peplus]|nr:hypothetical protein M5689_019135 [Euphorbia peplus]